MDRVTAGTETMLTYSLALLAIGTYHVLIIVDRSSPGAGYKFLRDEDNLLIRSICQLPRSRLCLAFPVPVVEVRTSSARHVCQSPPPHPTPHLSSKLSTPTSPQHHTHRPSQSEKKPGKVEDKEPEPRNREKVEVAAMGFSSLRSLTVSVAVKQH